MTLDAALITAHAQNDIAALIQLYTQAAEDADNTDAACFYLTQAFVFALQAGQAEAVTLNQRLAAYGRAEITTG